MPFMGELDGERVIPEQVSDQTMVICPYCDGEMRSRQATSDRYVPYIQQDKIITDSQRGSSLSVLLNRPEQRN